jgi:hypothetical protein
MLQYCPQYPFEIYEKSIPEYGMSQGVFHEGEEICGTSVFGIYVKCKMQNERCKIPLSPPLQKGEALENGNG